MTLSNLRGSLRVRLLGGTLFWIAASVLVAGWGLSSLFRQHVEAQFQAELTSHLDQLTAQFTLDAQDQPTLALPLSDPRLTRPYSGYYWQIDRLSDVASGGTPIAGQLRSRSLWDHVLVVSTLTPADGQLHTGRVSGPQGEMLGMVARRVRVQDDPTRPPRTFRLIAAANESFFSEPLGHFNGLLWLALGLLAAGLVLAAVVQVVVGLAPLRSLRTALAKVHSGETQRLEGNFPQEVMPLIEDFNHVLTQNADVVARARTQAGNLAHALKTPLSVLANAASDPHTTTASLAPLVAEQVAVARQQVNYHLARAQAAAASRLPGARTALLPALEGLVRVMERVHAERAITITLQPMAASLAFRGETQDLQEMLGNLLDNACKWARQRVEVSARQQDTTLRLTIDDDGPGLAAAQREAVIQRGVRADEQVPGSGLGLAIVDDLAQLYGGQLVLGDSPLGGLRVELVLPALG
ncbi:sensor histidine kinase [Rhodoferax sp.]|uniref:ATP-binding protein n=1 Tax=Rhodoferax sp. TaxID=50421 RepID=UPI002606F81E|nr:sensor histidine kinase [Rhodoferax sp.]MDD2926556.1 sensor histidine kinase [Rhodoferax sp.]